MQQIELAHIRLECLKLARAVKGVTSTDNLLDMSKKLEHYVIDNNGDDAPKRRPGRPRKQEGDRQA
jgi:hypothetical protein